MQAASNSKACRTDHNIESYQIKDHFAPMQNWEWGTTSIQQNHCKPWKEVKAYRLWGTYNKLINLDVLITTFLYSCPTGEQKSNLWQTMKQNNDRAKYVVMMFCPICIYWTIYTHMGRPICLYLYTDGTPIRILWDNVLSHISIYLFYIKLLW